jgi:hypothetical protein
MTKIRPGQVQPSPTDGQVMTTVGGQSVWAPPPGPGLLGFVFNQGSAVAVWDITHPLSFQPNVSVVDSGGSEVEGDVVYLTSTTLRITFSAAFSGTAYLS